MHICILTTQLILSKQELWPELDQMFATDADKVSDCCSENRMTANATKTKVMSIRTIWQKRAFLPDTSKEC